MEDPLKPLVALCGRRPEDVQAYLSKLLDAKLDDSSSRIISGQEEWLAVLSGLMDFMTFPLPQNAGWSVFQDNIDMVEKSMEVVQRASKRVDGLFFGTGHIVHQLLTRLLYLHCVFEVWDTFEESNIHEASSPSFMKARAHEVMFEIIQILGNSISTTEINPAMWQILQTFLVEILDVIKDLGARPSVLFPVTVEMFKRNYSLDKIFPGGSVRYKDFFEVELETPLMFNNFLVLGLDIVTQALSLPLKSRISLTSVMRMIPGTTRLVFDFCSSSACFASTKLRHKLLTQLVTNASPFYHQNPGLCGFLKVLPFRLLQFRFQRRQEIDVDEVRPQEAMPFIPSTKADVLSALALIRAQTWEDPKGFCISYLRSNLPSCDVETLSAIKGVIEAIDLGPVQTDFVTEVERRERELANQDRNRPIGEPGGVEDSAWRRQVQSLMQEMLGGDDIMWADEYTHNEFVSFVLDRLQLHFEKSLPALDSASRVSLAKLLNELICLLALCGGSQCSDVSVCRYFAAIYPCIWVVKHLLEGPDDDVTGEVRRRTYAALTHIIRHHSWKSGSEGFEWTTEIISRGIMDKERSSRLTAGNALGAFIRLMNRNQADIEPIFERLYHHFDNGKPCVKETLIISIGSIGCSKEPEVAAQALCFLIAQLGNPYPPLKGSAYMKIDTIKQRHNKSLYSLLGHHMDRVAPFLVSRYCTQPALITETCRLMSMSTATFISLTGQKTYPQLFANADLKVLQRISNELEVSILGLFARDSAQILAHIFQLPNPGQTQKGLDFINQIAALEVKTDPPDVLKLVKMCLVSLLGELVAEMGYQHKTTIAMAALKKVEQTISRKALNRQSQNSEVGTFLKQHAPGIMTHLSDLLQDVHTKASLPHKRAILRSLGVLATHIGRSVSNIAPQYMSTFQTMLVIPELSEVTLDSWYTFLITLEPEEIGPYVGPTTAAFVSSWPTLDAVGRELARKSLDCIIRDCGTQLGHHLDDVADLSTVPELAPFSEYLKGLRKAWTAKGHLQRILDRSSSDNLAVATVALKELKTFMLAEKRDFIRELASGDVFDPMVGQIMSALLAAACRDGERAEHLRMLAFEGIGVLGAIDPDRFEINFSDPTRIVLSNFMNEEEAILFTMHMIQDLLVGVFRATSEVLYQRHIGYALQQLLRVCHFTPSLIAGGSGGSVPIKVRNRWNSFPKHVIETLSPLLDAKYGINPPPMMHLQHPVYAGQSTYREWIQSWTCHLITKASGHLAKSIFDPFFFIVRNKDVVVAYHILPHLILNILISGDQTDTDDVRSELLAVLEDQVNVDSASSTDKKLLSAQAVFTILDHLNKWVRLVRQNVGNKKAESKRSRANQIGSNAEEQLLRVDSILSSIDQNLLARAALQCKAYARSLMNFESQIISLREGSRSHKDLPIYYERLHEIYSYLDEPDGMEGVSTLILSPSLEHQIRQHESTGRWTSAQSCWEVRLQQSPDNLDFHLGLLRCLRNLGHYDTLRTHVRGVLIRNPEWEASLAGFQVESAWMVGAWDDVQNMVERVDSSNPSLVMARLLLAIRSGDFTRISETLTNVRSVFGAPITAAGVKGYRRSYEASLNLHLTYELELIHHVLKDLPAESKARSKQDRRKALSDLSRTLSSRFESTLPAFRTREPVLSLRRISYMLSPIPRATLVRELGRSWLASAKIARKAGHWQTAYSALLQAKQTDALFSFIESAKLVKATGEPLRAVQELENSMRMLGIIEDGNVMDLVDDDETEDLKAKAQLLRARWMHESDRYDDNAIFKTFTNATELRPNWESCQFHLGRFHDECFKNLSQAEQANRGMKMILYTVRSFARAIRAGSKYVFQTVPRLLTIWLDFGEDKAASGTDVFKKINDTVAKAIKEAPVYKWYTAFPQIVSRIGHTNPDVFSHLSKLIIRVMEEYPKQALWLFTSVAKSTKSNREQRGRTILDQLRNSPKNAQTEIPRLVMQCSAMTNELLSLCDYQINDDSRKTLSMKEFPRLAALGNSQLIIPLQGSLSASLPPTSSLESTHQPFPSNAPTFEKFFDEIDIMHSLAKPRKITIQGSDGQVYMFLGKPKDDLRKDARLMDFNSIINKLLKANSESRRRHLHIRTYGVVTLNEECGFIQWVPNTIPIRPVLVKGYETRRIRSWTSEMGDTFKRIKDAKDRDAADMFLQKILPMFPPVFHDWFVETFPEPTAWLASRLAYGRTAAVMSMVGFILGLGDRHCENILLDSNTGDTVHVDFNCLFERGKTLETPERVPFRLTQNLVDGLGVTGVEGVFRIACEITLQLLRDHKDSLMSVLDAFIHDPLVEWEDERRKIERSERARRNTVKASVDLRNLAQGALNPIERKLKGIYSTGGGRQEKEISTSNLVQMLIQEATDPANLAKMYPGWAAWH